VSNTATGMRTAEHVVAAMTKAGNGAGGYVFATAKDGEVGHVFNVINQNGTVRFLDGQTGRAAIWSPQWRIFWLAVAGACVSGQSACR